MKAFKKKLVKQFIRGETQSSIKTLDEEDEQNLQLPSNAALTADRLYSSNPELEDVGGSIDQCEWEELHHFMADMEVTTLKQVFESPLGETKAIPFQTLLWKAPVELVLFFLDLLPDEEYRRSICLKDDIDGNTGIHLFCANCESFGEKELRVLEQLVKGSPESLGVTNVEGETPLHLLVTSNACTNSGNANAELGAKNAVSILLRESTQQALIQSSSGCTPLHVAVAHKAFESVVTLLIETLPDSCEISDNRGMLPLHYAAAFQYSYMAPIQAMIEANCDALTATTEDGDTPLHIFISNQRKSIESIDQSILALIGVLTSDSSDRSDCCAIQIQNKEKLTPIHCCALFDAPSQITDAIMQCPVSSSASLLTNASKATALHLAVAQPTVGTSIDNVLAIGTSNAAKTKDRLKRTPLHVAVQNENCTAKLVEVLFKLCPEAINMTTQRGHLPLHLAAQSRAKVEVIEALIRLDSSSVKILNKSKNTPLHDAAKYQASPEVVRILIDAYKDAVYMGNQYGNFPIHCATAYQACRDVVTLLIAAWPDGASMQNRNKDTPLHYAAAYTSCELTIDLLIKSAPSSVLLLNKDGQLPIDRARANNAPTGIIRILEEAAKEWTEKTCTDTSELDVQSGNSASDKE